jgi:outer membrane lipoprotein-sorting protein
VALAVSASAQPAAARVAQIENYINGIDTLEADFSQTGPDGSLTTGKLYLDRPGLMRIDYDPPSRILMIAEDWRLIYYDGSIKQVTTIPLSQTPLSILLDEDVTLEGDTEILNIDEGDETFTTTLVRRDAADQGSVALTFNKDPIQLLSWVVTDPQGYRTQLVLRNIKLGGEYERRLFHWRDPKFYGYPDEDDD